MCEQFTAAFLLLSPVRSHYNTLEQAEQALYPLRYPMVYLLVWKDRISVEMDECATVRRNVMSVFITVCYVLSARGVE